MPTKPKDVWRRVSERTQNQILDELSDILTEVIHEHLRAGK